MKKLLVVAIMGVMVLSFAACGTKDDTVTVDVHSESETEQIVGDDPSTWGPDLSEEDMEQVVSPFVDYDTIEEAKEHIEFDVVVPEKIDGYDEAQISIMDESMFQIVYRNADNEICIRKQIGTGDISGDYNVYDEENTVDYENLQILMRGDDGKVRNVTWTKGEYAYSIYTDAEMTQDDMLQLISQIQ